MGITGLEQLDALVKRLASVAQLGDEAPKLAAEAIGDAAKAQFQAGRSPSGDPWKAKKDGSKALVNAPEHVTFVANGDGIYESAPDHYKYHRTGTKRNGKPHLPKRSVYPAGASLPASWQAAVDKALEREFAKRMR